MCDLYSAIPANMYGNLVCSSVPCKLFKAGMKAAIWNHLRHNSSTTIDVFNWTLLWIPQAVMDTIGTPAMPNSRTSLKLIFRLSQLA